MLAFVTSSAQASTQCNPNGSNYYGSACLFSSSHFYGLSDDLEASVFDGSDLTTTNHIIDSIWAVNSNSSPVHFLEAGIFKGDLCTAADQALTSCTNYFDAYSRPRFYWIADRGDTVKSGYFGHIDQNNNATNLPTLGQNYFAEISRPTNSTDWAIQAGPFPGTSGANPLTPNLIRTGIEVVEPANSQVCAQQSSLQYLDTSGTWHTGWTSNAETGGNNPPYVEFTSSANTAALEWNGETYSSCFGGAANSSTGTSSASTLTTSSSTTTPTTVSTPITTTSTTATTPVTGFVATLLQAATSIAGGFGDSQVSSLSYALSTRSQAALDVSGDTVPGTEPVVVVEMQGQFTGSNLPRPPGAAAPTGSVLTLILDTSTLAVTDFAIESTQPDLSALGNVSTIGITP